jgi:hypothetical protein
MADPKLAADPMWHDREIRFDIKFEHLQLRRGEVMIDSMRSIEDTKGNNGESGELQVTNLRLIWISTSNIKTNLSVGLGAVVNINIRAANSRSRGTSQALYVLTKFNGSRFEFIFTNLIKNSPRLFTTVQAVFRAYDTSRLFRELKLRGAVISQQELIQLPEEQIFNKISGIWNLSADQVRLSWLAACARNDVLLAAHITPSLSYLTFSIPSICAGKSRDLLLHKRPCCLVSLSTSTQRGTHVRCINVRVFTA